MKQLILVASVSILITGCVTVAKVNDRIQPWETASLQQIIDAWGPPTKEQTVGTRIFLVWNDVAQESGIDIGISIGGSISRNAGVSLSTLLPGATEENVCSRVIEIDSEQTILGVSWNGDPSTCFNVIPARAEPVGS